MSDMVDQDKIWKALEAFSSCMMVTHNGSDLHARPMSPILRPLEGVIYFIADRRGFKDDELSADNSVCLTFSSGGTQVAISGKGKVVEDRAILTAIFTTAAKAFFPAGPSDPNCIGIAVMPSQGELWEGSNFAVSLFKMATAIATGNRVELGQTVKTAL